MSMVSFKRGANLNNLAIADGQFILNTDERSIYIDVGTERLRIGDFVSVANIAALPTSGANTTALYYVEDINCLAKWDGSAWIQINRDTGVKEVKVEGTGNAITAASYDATTRILTLTKGETFATPTVVDSKISDKVGEIDGTVKAYVDAKTDGIASDEALTVLTTRVTTAEGEIDDLQAAIGTDGSVTKAIADAKKAGTDAQTAAEAAQAAADSKTTMAAVEEKGYATKTEAQGYADAKDTAIAEAKQAGTDAQSAVDALSGKVGTVAEGKTVVKMIEEAQAAATYDDAEVKASIKAISDDYLKAADKTELSNSIADVKSDVDAFFAAAETGDAAIDTLKEIQNYIDTHGEAAATLTTKVGALETTVGKAAGDGAEATGLVKDVADNAAAISAEKQRAMDKEAELATADTTNLQAAKDYADEKITDLGIGDYAKKADLDELSDKITADEVIINKLNGADTVDGSVAKALKDAKAYADGLAGNYDAKGAAATAEQNAKDYADGLADNYDAKGSATTAETNAKTYADGLAKNYDAAGAATTAETNAKAHAESLLVWGEF